MNLLLDTHTFLWFIQGDPKISDEARRLIEDESNEKVLSIASPWEIAIKVSLGKLALNEPFEAIIPCESEQGGFQVLPILLDHTSLIAKLPRHHRDPFDRLIIAQAIVEGMPILSRDAAFDAYGITRLW